MAANMESTGKPLKSALDLALERLARTDGAAAKLSAAQKAALAEIERQAKAKLAELEILGQDRLAKEGTDPEKIQAIQAELRAAMDKVRSRAESDKERVRQG
jgi:leucyl aminopeptidase (aminopeptidase T)